MNARFDVLVVGAGPGGMAAATIAAEAGRSVCIIDDNASAGGQIWRGADLAASGVYAKDSKAAQWLQRYHASPCMSLPGMRVVNEPVRGVLRLEGAAGKRDVGFVKLIVATGARERFLPFPGWTLPGVMGAGAAQAFVKSGFEVAGRRVVVAGTGPLLLAAAAGLASHGAGLMGVFEQASWGHLVRFAPALLRFPSKLVEGARYKQQMGKAAFRAGCWVVKAEGDGRLQRVTVTDGSKQWTIDCDLLACGFHLVANLELPILLGCRTAGGQVWVDEQCRSSREDVFCVGELTGVGGLDKALLEGQIAGHVAAGAADRAQTLQRQLGKQRGFVEELDRAFSLRDELKTLATPETLVCRCEDVAYSALEEHSSWRSAKLHTRAGMGACQGRICGASAEVLFGWRNQEVRPPVFPATVSTMAAECEPPDR